jgi:hypothetical protein
MMTRVLQRERRSALPQQGGEERLHLQLVPNDGFEIVDEMRLVAGSGTRA